METERMNYEEKELHPVSGFKVLAGVILGFAVSIAAIVFSCILLEQDQNVPGGVLLAAGIVLCVLLCFLLPGFKVINPREAIVLVLFGNYYGTLRREGFYWVNPFVSAVNPTVKASAIAVNAGGSGASVTLGESSLSRKVSLKTMTLNNEKQKVNDVLGNPIIIGTVVIWRVVDPTKAVFNVNNYKSFLSIQCDSTVRNIARLYPYDASEEDSDEKSLRGSSQEIADKMKEELQSRVEAAGIEITEARITHLSYAEEIAAAMLQRQQAVAIIAARKKIVEGAVGMVEMALEQLSQNAVVDLDEERKAAMVSNLLVVLCGNKDAQPIVNSGSIY